MSNKQENQIILNRLSMASGRTFLKMCGFTRAAMVFERYSSIHEVMPEIFYHLTCYMGLAKVPIRSNTVTIEPINKCNLRCKMCDLKKMKRSIGMMDLNLFKKIVDSNKEIKRICLSVWGEPLLNPYICEMIRYARRRDIYVLMFSNATMLTREKAHDIIDSGLNCLTFSLDGVGETYERVRGWNFQSVKKNIDYFLKINNAAGNPTRVEINVVEFNENLGGGEEVERMYRDRVDAISITPLMKKDDNLRTKRCNKLWRNVVIYWDGTVVPCCVDINASMSLGNVEKYSLAEIFNCSSLQNMRKAHVDKKFPDICLRCNEYYT